VGEYNTAIANGELDHVTDHVKSILGRRPKSLAEVLAAPAAAASSQRLS
jgi:hypothetical protein